MGISDLDSRYNVVHSISQIVGARLGGPTAAGLELIVDPPPVVKLSLAGEDERLGHDRHAKAASQFARTVVDDRELEAMLPGMLSHLVVRCVRVHADSDEKKLVPKKTPLQLGDGGQARPRDWAFHRVKNDGERRSPVLGDRAFRRRATGRRLDPPGTVDRAIPLRRVLRP